MQYSVYEFFTKDEIERDWLVAILSDYHFDGFEETSDSLKAYVPTDKMRSLLVKEILHDNDFSHIAFTETPLEDKNWNEEWEKNFEPVTIAGKVAIRAPFHAPIKAEFELVIEPKMSFGTGHHATTASVVEMMLHEDFKGKQVLDFGSGTGVLAILAEKLGAEKVLAIDNEEWAYHNCVENAERNSCSRIQTVLADERYELPHKFDVILANINRNVVLKNIERWQQYLNPAGVLIVSGILLSDERDVINEAAKHRLHVKNILRNNGWLAISFTHL